MPVGKILDVRKSLYKSLKVCCLLSSRPSGCSFRLERREADPRLSLFRVRADDGSAGVPDWRYTSDISGSVLARLEADRDGKLERRSEGVGGAVAEGGQGFKG